MALYVPKGTPVKACREDDGVVVALRVEDTEHALKVKEINQDVRTYTQKMLEESAAFTAAFKADVASAGNMSLLLVTPNTDTDIVLTYDIAVELETDIELYEDVTATAGDAVVAYNCNRKSMVPAALVITSTPTAVTPGTTIIKKHHLIAGGRVMSGFELLLKKNKKYLLKATHVPAATNFMAVTFDWREVVAE